jgi:prepilin-type N-terminal cleavage/methylation domain-containing protein
MRHSVENRLARRRRTAERGFSLLEVMIALSILMIVALGLLPLGVIATNGTENQGHLVARCTEYAQDKLEQLLVLTYGDSVTDTRFFPAQPSGGTGLAIGGSSTPATPVALYVDYLDVDGTLIPSSGTTPPSGWFYKRVWGVTQEAANLKRVTVTAIVRSSVGGGQVVPQATVVALKSYPF